MTRRFCFGALCLLVLGAAPALAAPEKNPTAALLGELDADAAVYGAVRLRAQEDLLPWLRKFSGSAGVFVASWLGELSSKAVDGLGFDPLAPAGWKAGGIDPDTPVVVSLFAIDLPAAEKYARGPREKLPLLYLRHRLAVRVVNQKKVLAAVARLAKTTSASEAPLFLVAKADSKRLGAALGDARQAKAALAQLRKAKIVAFQIEDQGGSFLFVRVSKTALVVDVLNTFGSAKFSWKRDGKGLLKAALRKRKGGAAGLLGETAAKRAFASDLGVYARPGRLVDFAKADALHVGDAGAAEACEKMRPLASAGQFEDGALTVNIEPTAIELSGVWTLRQAAIGGLPFSTADDGLLDLAGAKDAALIGAVYLENTGAMLAGLPRPGAFASAGELDAALSRCTPARAVALGFGWPQLLALAVDRNVPADLKGATAGVRNVAWAYKTFFYRDAAFGAIVASLDAAGASSADGFLARLGKPTGIKLGKREVEAWKQTCAGGVCPPWAVRTTLDGGKKAFGAVFGGDAALRWLWGAASPSPSGVSPAYLALGRADIVRLLGSDLPEGVGDRVGPIVATAEVTPDGLLVVNAKLQLK